MEIVKGLIENNSKLDVGGRDFSQDLQNAFFDVRTTNTNIPSKATYQLKEFSVTLKKRKSESIIGKL